jgi:hypothetical protein
MAEVAVSKNFGTAGLDPTHASELAKMIPEATGSNQTHPATFRKKIHLLFKYLPSSLFS